MSATIDRGTILCLEDAAGSLALARLIPSEAERGAAIAAEMLDDISADLLAADAALAERVGYARQLAQRGGCVALWHELDWICERLRPLIPPPEKPAAKRRPRRPSLTTMLMRAKTVGVDVAVGPDGAATFRCSQPASADTMSAKLESNEWDGVLSRGKH